MNAHSIAYQFSPEGQHETAEINETGEALGLTAFERGDRLTDDEQRALTHWSMFGSDGCPVRKLGRGWTIDHPAFRGASLYTTKRAAVKAWEIVIAKLVTMSGLEARERRIAAKT